MRAYGADAIVTIGAYLPDVCVKCGRKDWLTRRPLTLVRSPLWLYAFLGLGLFPYFLVRSGMPRGWASMCLCGHCFSRYENGNYAKVVVALPVLCALVALTSVRVGEEMTESGVLAVVLALSFVGFFVTLGITWLVNAHFVNPRILRLEAVFGNQMRVSGFDRDALADCAAYADYWARASAHQAWQAQSLPGNGYHQGYGPPAYVAPAQVAHAASPAEGPTPSAVTPAAPTLEPASPAGTDAVANAAVTAPEPEPAAPSPAPESEIAADTTGAPEKS